MMIAVVLFARNGILGIADRVLEWWRRKTA
jgi:hypothetical protein